MLQTVRFLGYLCLGFALLLARPQDAQAQVFAKPSMDNIVKTLIRMGSLDINKNYAIDLYGRMLHCDLVQVFYKNDFEWEKVRKGLREEVQKNISSFPVGYAYESGVRLGRYDFKRKLFAFVSQGGDVNVNTFTMEAKDKNFCATDNKYWVPSVYQMVLDKPIKIAGLFIEEEEAKALLARLPEANDGTRAIFMRVNLRIVYVAEIITDKEIREEKKTRVNNRFTQKGPRAVQNIKNSMIRLDSKLDSIEFYEDSKYQKIIYTYRPYP